MPVSTDPLPRRPPGPAKAFDVDAVLASAMMLFWERGYEGTSIADLTHAMGIEKPSLYRTFGNKEALYRQAVERFAQIGSESFAECIEARSAREFADAFLRSVIDLYTNPELAPGCFLIQSAIATNPSSGGARAASSEQRRANEAAVCEQLARPEWRSSLPKGFTPRALASYLASVGNGIAIQAADGSERGELLEIATIAMQVWPAL